VVLANLGTPSAPTEAAVREFLREFLADPLVVDWPSWIWKPILERIVLRKRPSRVAELYREIWWPEGSPLEVETERIRARLSESTEHEVAVAYRYGDRSLSRILLRDARAIPTAVIPLFPQRTSSSSGSIVHEVERFRGRSVDVDALEIAPDDPGYIGALADRAREAMAGRAVEHLLVSFHGIPVRYDRRERGRYAADCERTTRALLRALGWDPGRATLCYQSRFGPERWLGPATADLLRGLPARGIRRVAVITPGFLTEGLETLEEIGRLGRSQLLGAGGEELVRIPAVADHPAFVAGLLRLVERWRTTG
jgi:ferrochelatase